MSPSQVWPALIGTGIGLYFHGDTWETIGFGVLIVLVICTCYKILLTPDPK
jgi:hypothetical protein